MAHRHSDPANIAMIGRMIAASGKRAAGMDPDQIQRLNDLHRSVDDAIRVAVAGQRSQGITWESIGQALGVTKQAALMRWGR